ncbi:MAG TPA: hypothetical protein VHB97_24405 [Polyangia bacterium]|jgi:hypothetical protein|nr:hypothetical protein [Polyangia bacterium]
MSFLARARGLVRLSTLLDLLGAALLVASLASLFPRSWVVGFYDEGLILTDAKMIDWGFAPYRDFYSNYPPGTFLTVLALWKLVGDTVRSVRILGIILHIVIALLSGRIAGRLAGRRFSLFAAAIVLAWLNYLFVGVCAWTFALAALLGFIELVGPPAQAATQGLSRARSAAAGFALGLVGCYRHDLLVYFGCALVLVAGTYFLWQKTWPALDWRALIAGAALPLALVWIPTFARAGIHQVVADLYSDQVHYVLPARKLPFPPLLKLHHHYFPAFFGRIFEACIVTMLIGPFLGLTTLFFARRRGQNVILALTLTAAALAVIPQGAGRTDLPHVLYTVAPGLILLVGLLERLLLATPGWYWKWPLSLVIAAFLIWPAYDQLHSPADALLPREPPVRAVRQQLMAYIQDHTQPGERIFISYRQHRHLLANEIDLYYYCDRPGATRYMQYDPNVINRADVQQEMANELERNHVRYVVLMVDGGYWDEPNESRKIGATVLDDYIRSHYKLVTSFGRYEVHQRIE